MFRNLIKKLTLFVLSCSLIAAMPGGETYAASSGYYAYPVTCQLSGDNATDIVSVALSQNGYQELQHSNYTKYNMWYYGADYNVAWCAIFISWCANQAGIPSSVIKKTAYVSGMSTGNMSSNGYGCPAYAFSATTAQPGDIVYIDNTGDKVSDHVGMVYAVDDTYIYTVEGNASDSVRLNTYLVSNGYLIVGASDGGTVSKTSIVFYARPQYGYTDPATIGTSTEETGTSTSVIPEITDCNLWYLVGSSSLNVRMGPSTSYKSLGTVSSGTLIHATGMSGNWVRFDYGDVEGWVSVKYLKETENPNPEEETTTEEGTETITEDGTESTTEDGTETTTEESTVSTTEETTVIPTENTKIQLAASNVYKITASSLNVRKGPGTNYSAIGSVSRGSQVTVLETSGDWGKINYNGSYGWIKMSYCEKVETTTTSTSEKTTTTTTAEVTTTTTEKAATTTTKTATTTTEKATTTTEKATTTTTEKAATTTTAEAAGGNNGSGATTWTYKVTASSLSVRKGNGTGYSRLGYLSNGTVVTVTQISSNNWGKINYNGSVGWISLDYCKLISENKAEAVTTTESAKAEATEKTTVTTTESTKATTAETSVVVKSWNYRITADVLNVRSGGGTGYSAIGTLKNGDQVVVTEINSNNWGKINYNGKEGWISLKYAKLLSTNTATVTTAESAASTTTEAPAVTTTEKPAATTEAPAVTTTEKPAVTTEAPAVTTTEKPAAATEAPTVTTTEEQTTVTTESTTSSEQAAQQVYFYKVNASSLNVRSGPGTSYSSCGSLARGVIAEVTEISSNNWGKINYNGSEGWISLDYCVRQ